MDNREIPGILKQLRIKLDLSQEDFAAKLGVAFSTLNRWENGRSMPRGKAKEAILALLSDLSDSSDMSDETPVGRKRTSRANLLTTKSMEQMLRTAACSIRGEKNVDPLRFPKPKAREDQTNIMTALDHLDDKRTFHANKKTTIQALFKTTLNKLMTGDIRVADLDIDVKEVEV